MDTEFQREEVKGSNNSTFEAYVTEYNHTVDTYNGTYETPVKMMFNPNNGASVVGNPTEGFYLYIPVEGGSVRQYKVDTSHGANADIASTQDIRDLAYLLDSDFASSSKTGGPSVSTNYEPKCGPNNELTLQTQITPNTYSETPTYEPRLGGTSTITVDGVQYEIATPSETSRSNYMTELLSGDATFEVTDPNQVAEEQTSPEGETPQTGPVYTENSYSSMLSENGIFLRGLRGSAEKDFPWIETSLAQDFASNYAQNSTFNGVKEFDSYLSDLTNVINAANQGIPIIMKEDGSEKAIARTEKIHNAYDLTQQYISVKQSIDVEQFRRDIVTYNDNVEQAKVENTRKQLRAACQEYNDTNCNVVRTWTTTDAGYHPSGRYARDIQGQDADGNTIYIYKEYDKIEFDGAWEGIDFCWGLFNMKTDRMVQELQSRGIRVSIEDRPENTK